MRKPIQLSRRTFLRGAGGVAMGLPFLDAMAARAAAPAAKRPARMACLFFPNGVNVKQWFPADVGRDYQLSPTLKPLDACRDEVTVLTNLWHRGAWHGHEAPDIWLTGAKAGSGASPGYRNSISVDQVAARHFQAETRLPSLVLSSEGGVGHQGYASTLSFNSQGQPIPAESKPRLIFERLFGDEPGGTRDGRRARFAEDASILDAVRDEASSLHRRLGADDRRKLDEYLTNVREVERRVHASEAWVDVPKPKVDPAGLHLDAAHDDPAGPQAYIRTMLDLIVLALRTDSTRVATYMFSREADWGVLQNFPARVGISKLTHHTLSHVKHDDPEYENLAKVDRFFVEQFAYLVGRLKASPEGDGTVLDHTMLLFGSGSSTTHNYKNLPLVVAGGRGLGLRHGRHLRFGPPPTFEGGKSDGNNPLKPGDVPFANLFVTMLDRMGVPVKAFADSTGELSDLTRQ